MFIKRDSSPLTICRITGLEHALRTILKSLGYPQTNILVIWRSLTGAVLKRIKQVTK